MRPQISVRRCNFEILPHTTTYSWHIDLCYILPLKSDKFQLKWSHLAITTGVCSKKYFQKSLPKDCFHEIKSMCPRISGKNLLHINAKKISESISADLHNFDAYAKFCPSELIAKTITKKPTRILCRKFPLCTCVCVCVCLWKDNEKEIKTRVPKPLVLMCWTACRSPLKTDVLGFCIINHLDAALHTHCTYIILILAFRVACGKCTWCFRRQAGAANWGNDGLLKNYFPSQIIGFHITNNNICYIQKELSICVIDGCLQASWGSGDMWLKLCCFSSVISIN